MLQSPCVCRRSFARAPLPYRLPLARPSPARSHSSLPTCATIAGLRAGGISSGAWNIAVRTRGVFTHRDDFLEPACVERGLVRTGTLLGRPGTGKHGISIIPESAPPLFRLAHVFNLRRPSLLSPSPMYLRSHRHPVQ